MPSFTVAARTMVEVKRPLPEGWEEYRALRLEALGSDPTAFGSSVEEEASLPEAEWRRRAANALLAFFSGKPVGMIVFVVSPRAKTRHVADIFSVYVKPSQRGRGIGKLLLESALKEIAKDPEVVKIKLTVNPEQKAAVGLYRGSGFVEVGRLRRELRVDGRYYDELMMEKHIRG